MLTKQFDLAFIIIRVLKYVLFSKLKEKPSRKDLFLNKKIS